MDEKTKGKYLVKLIGGYAININADSIDHAKGLAEGMALTSLKGFQLIRTEVEEATEDESTK